MQGNCYCYCYRQSQKMGNPQYQHIIAKRHKVAPNKTPILSLFRVTFQPVFSRKHKPNYRKKPCRNDEKKPFFSRYFAIMMSLGNEILALQRLVEKWHQAEIAKRGATQTLFHSIEYLVVIQLVVVGNNKHIPSDDNDNDNNNNKRDETTQPSPFTLHFTSCKANTMAYSHIRLDVKCEM